MLRCKDGDLALVTQDELGCEINVGRMVVVSGPIRIHDQFGPTWLIQPTQPGQWAVTGIGGVVIRTPPLHRVEHPDKWLMPLRPPEPAETATIQAEQPAPETRVPEDVL